MTQLTEEEFERILDKRLKTTEARLIQRIDVSQSELARITNAGFTRTDERFDELEQRQDMTENQSL